MYVIFPLPETPISKLLILFKSLESRSVRISNLEAVGITHPARLTRDLRFAGVPGHLSIASGTPSVSASGTETADIVNELLPTLPSDVAAIVAVPAN